MAGAYNLSDEVHETVPTMSIIDWLDISSGLHVDIYRDLQLNILSGLQVDIDGDLQLNILSGLQMDRAGREATRTSIFLSSALKAGILLNDSRFFNRLCFNAYLGRRNAVSKKWMQLLQC